MGVHDLVEVVVMSKVFQLYATGKSKGQYVSHWHGRGAAQSSLAATCVSRGLHPQPRPGPLRGGCSRSLAWPPEEVSTIQLPGCSYASLWHHRQLSCAPIRSHNQKWIAQCLCLALVQHPTNMLPSTACAPHRSQERIFESIFDDTIQLQCGLALAPRS